MNVEGAWPKNLLEERAIRSLRDPTHDAGRLSISQLGRIDRRSLRLRSTGVPKFQPGSAQIPEVAADKAVAAFGFAWLRRILKRRRECGVRGARRLAKAEPGPNGTRLINARAVDEFDAALEPRFRDVAEPTRCIAVHRAPELNPVEYIWGYWKHHELPNFCPRDFSQLSYHARHTLRRMRRRPTLVMAFWEQADLFPL